MRRERGSRSGGRNKQDPPLRLSEIVGDERANFIIEIGDAVLPVFAH